MTMRSMNTVLVSEPRPKQLFMYPDLCVGCHLCSYACSVTKFGELSKQKTAIRIVRKDGALEYPNYCIQCEDKTCMKYCPTDALVWDQQVGTVDLLDERCIGCGICAIKCEYSAIAFLDREVIKCDLCGGDPACVKYCPTEAIVYKDSTPELEAEREAIARQYLGEVQPVLQLTKDGLKQDFAQAEAKGITYPTAAQVNAVPHPMPEVRDAKAGAGTTVPRRKTGEPVQQSAALRSATEQAMAAGHMAAANPQSYTGAQVDTPLGGYNPPLVASTGEKVSDLERRVLVFMNNKGARTEAEGLFTEDMYKVLSVTHSVIAFALVEMERKGLVVSQDKKRFWLAA
jgi:anaerobic carbon-monoxide dehydrogenase iron sulfur subunit